MSIFCTFDNLTLRAAVQTSQTIFKMHPPQPRLLRSSEDTKIKYFGKSKSGSLIKGFTVTIEMIIGFWFLYFILKASPVRGEVYSSKNLP